MRDPRVRAVEWRDLTPMRPIETVKQLLIPVPWITGSLVLAYYGHYLLALPVSFILFLTGLRVVHDAYHLSLGLSRKATDVVIYFLSMMMTGSLHAVKLTHLHHHQHCMDDEDVEAASALMPWWKAIIYGPIFPIKNHAFAIRTAKASVKPWIYAELATTIVMFALAFSIPSLNWLRYHMIAMTIGQCLTAFFAVWTVHHDCDRSHFIARTMRNRVKSIVAFEMFFHVEHHLYPKVPTCHLLELSRRLDQAAPELSSKQVY